MIWYCYILECSDRTLYTGITSNLQRRVKEHNSGSYIKSKYTYSHRPVKLVYSEKFKTKSAVLKRELEIKGWSKAEKLKLLTKNRI